MLWGYRCSSLQDDVVVVSKTMLAQLGSTVVKTYITAVCDSAFCFCGDGGSGSQVRLVVYDFPKYT